MFERIFQAVAQAANFHRLPLAKLAKEETKVSTVVHSMSFHVLSFHTPSSHLIGVLSTL